MYVCLCNGVTDKTVRDAARTGVDSLPALMAKTGCGTCCGSCLPLAQEILDHERRSSTVEADIPRLSLAYA